MFSQVFAHERHPTAPAISVNYFKREGRLLFIEGWWYCAVGVGEPSVVGGAI